MAVCWCGLGPELHDGREMDAAGDMHRFGEPVRRGASDKSGPFEDPKPSPEVVIHPAVRKLLVDAKEFFDGRVIRMSKSGFKWPPYFVTAAEDMSKRIGNLLDDKDGAS